MVSGKLHNERSGVSRKHLCLFKYYSVGVFGVLDFVAMTKLSGYSFLVFNLLCAPCFAAIGAIRREMNSAKWTWFAISYQCGCTEDSRMIVPAFLINDQPRSHIERITLLTVGSEQAAESPGLWRRAPLKMSVTAA